MKNSRKVCLDAPSKRRRIALSRAGAALLALPAIFLGGAALGETASAGSPRLAGEHTALVLLAEAAAPPSVFDTKPQKLTVVGPIDGGAAPAPVPSTEVERYCMNIADQAQEARFALQTRQLNELEAQIQASILELEAKRQEHQDWLQRRQAFLDGTSTVVVEIYAQMRPDAAAEQLSKIDREAAASVLTKLKSRTASAILSEMPSDIAATLAGIIVERTTGQVGSAAAPEGEQQS